MQPGITFERTWSDDDVIELTIQVSNDTSLFENSVYIGPDNLAQIVSELTLFREAIHGGLYDISIGAFGPEYAKGAFHARLHFIKPGFLGHGRRLHISTHQETEFHEFSRGLVASEAKMYLMAEPIQLDTFIEELRKLVAGATNIATFKCLSRLDA